MPLWNLNYYVGDRNNVLNGRNVNAEFDDLSGENIRKAHEYVRSVSDGAGTFEKAFLVDETENLSDEPVPGEEMAPMWVTYVPFDPDADPDAEDFVYDEPRREKFEFPERLFQVIVDAKGNVRRNGPALGSVIWAVRQRLRPEGRDGFVQKMHFSETGD